MSCASVRALLAATAVLGSGCYTGLVAIQVPQEGSAKIEGLRYYLPRPHLVLEELPGDKWDARVVYVIDRSREFAVQPTQVLAKVNATIEFNDDGTLKSFQLNQHSGDVPESFINGFKDVAVKMLELEKAAADEELKAAEGDGTGTPGPPSAAKKDGVPAGGKETRRLYTYAINGSDAIKWTASKPIATMELGPPTKPEPKLKLAKSSDGKQVVISLSGEPLGTADLDKLAFFDASGKPIKAPDKAVLATKAKTSFNPAAGTATLEKADLTAKKVSHIGLGSAKPEPVP